MSMITDILADCDTHGIQLLATGDNGLYVDGPVGTLTTDRMERLKANKPALLEFLAKDLSTNPQACPSCDIRVIDPGSFDTDGWPIESIPWPAPGDRGEQETSTRMAEILPGTCDRCGCTQYRDVPIHDGLSTRRDCARCGRTYRFPVWHGQKRKQSGNPK